MAELQLSQTEAARFIGVHKMVLSGWKRKEVLVPLSPPEGKLVLYGFRDLVAGFFAKVALEDLHFQQPMLGDIVAIVQRGDEEELKHAVILTVRTQPGFMRHIFVSDTTLLATEEAEFLKLEQTQFADWDEFLAYLDEQGKLISCSTLYEAVQAIIMQVAKKLEQDNLAKATAEAGNEAC